MDDLSVRLKLLGEDEIRRIAVVKVSNASTTDHGLPKPQGLMDARMGSTDRSILCQTCHTPHCAGHFGCIEFPCHVLLVGHIKRVVQLLRCVCVCCSQPLFSATDVGSILESLPPSLERLKAISDVCRNKVSSCPSCNSPVVAFSESNKIFIQKTVSAAALEKMEDEERAWHRQRFTPDDIYSIFEKIPDDTLRLLGMDPEQSHPKCAVTRVILVLPPAQRPTLRTSDGGKGRGEDDMTVLYQDVVRAKTELETKLDKPAASLLDDPVWTSFCKLQLAIACLVKNSFRKTVELPGVSSAGLHGRGGAVRTMRDLEHRLKGKTGRLRGTLNAKRTDFSARTVVGIDMVHDIWQLGVPRSRMKILTIPVRVTAFNMEEMQARIMVGATGDKGAVNILQPLEGQEPRMIFLGLMTPDARMGLAASLRPGWIVERHMQEGDWVWFNRQPTLHKMNIQAFQIYPVDGLTFRLPLPCTRPFNADFDGDEMNMHVPQSIEATTEAQELMAVPFNMVSPSNTSTIIALVQESLVSWFRLTSRNVIVSRDVFFQLLAQVRFDPRSPSYADMPTKETPWIPSIPQPAVIKSPKGPRWTGKQILQVLLPESINVTRAVRDGDIQDSASWLNANEDIVIIRKGVLLLGRLCKSTLGGGPSLVHVLWKDVGPWASAKFVSDAQRIGNAWNQRDALCIGISDCILDDDIVSEVDDLVATAMGKADALESTHFSSDVKEMRAAGLMQDVLRAAGALVLKRMDKNTALSTVVQSGSKGNALNLSQIMGVVGQQVRNLGRGLNL
jgi:DNA-directed RNA polymerase II subunit RPB1